MVLQNNQKDFTLRWERLFKKNFCIILLIFFSYSNTFSQKANHQLWTNLLSKNVTVEGKVNYKKFINDSLEVNAYLSELETNFPKTNWIQNEILAYWINAYNAYTIKLITLHYPIKGIKEIGVKIPFVNSTWDIKFISIANESLDLNNIEHSKIRKQFSEPRIHMALVCASKSCPILLQEAYTADQLDAQLTRATKLFLHDNSKNQINAKSSKLSLLFKWYSLDFKKMGGVRNFINKYSDTKINSKTKLNYLDYDWSLNE